MNKAEVFRLKRGHLSVMGYLRLIQLIDAKAVVSMTDLGPVIQFSDGSLHRIADNAGPQLREKA